MKIFVKGNKEIRVEDHYEDKYLNEGWDLIDEKGKIIKTGLGTDDKAEKKIKKLQEDNKKLKDALTESEKENDALVAKIQELEAAAK